MKKDDEKRLLEEEFFEAQSDTTEGTLNDALDVDMIKIKKVKSELFEVIASSIDNAFDYKEGEIKYKLPLPRQWLGQRLFYIWIIPILIIKRVRKYLYSFYCYLCFVEDY